MPDPLTFEDVSPRFALPLLFAGQAQKEFTVNEALARIDAGLHPSVMGSASVPPASPERGDGWLVAGKASGEWSGREDAIAVYSGGAWLFVAPRPGMRLYDQGTSAFALFDGGWKHIAAPTKPAGGNVVDSEARACIAGLVDALREAGLFGT